MSFTGPNTGNVTIDGLTPSDWALQVFLPPFVPAILGQAVAIFVCYWEFVVLFPSEVRIWKRLLRRGHFRWQFAPFMTLFMRYMMICYASSAAFVQYSTTSTDRACIADSVVFIVTVLAINTSSIISMAWRSHAVAKPVIEKAWQLRLVQSVLGFMTLAAISMVWWSMIYGQTVGSFLSRQQAGICTSDYSFTPDATNLAHEPNFWYYVVCILFDATCMIVISLSLKKLAKRSTGFSKLISELFIHSLGYFIIIFLLYLLGIVWLRVQNAFWAANFIQMIQASIVVRVLIAEQDRAQRPHDTVFFDETAYPGGRTTRFTETDRYASDSRFAGNVTSGGSAPGLDLDDSRIADEEQALDTKFADSYGMRPRVKRTYDSEYGASEAGQSEMQASSKTAHSDRSGGTDDKIEVVPTVTVQHLAR